MILQALTEYYQALEREGKIDAPGWIKVKVSYALCLAVDGTLERVDFMQTEQPRGKKMVLAPQSISLPAPVKRTVGVAANFLCDNSSYFLGIDNKGKSQRTQECFAACKALHESLLKDVDSPAAQAVLAFFRTWDPQEARENPALQEHLDGILAGGNLIFRTAEGFVHNDPTIQQAWENDYNAAEPATGHLPRHRCDGTHRKYPSLISKTWRRPIQRRGAWLPSTLLGPSCSMERRRT